MDYKATLEAQPWTLVFPRGALAQLGERRLCKPEVTGSIPVRSTFRNACTTPKTALTQAFAAV
jgi:hypothetical protein